MPDTNPTPIPQPSASPAYEIPKGACKEFTWARPAGQPPLEYAAHAEWLPLKENNTVYTDIFSMAYLAKSAAPATRPLVFAFNGGPGSSSVWLHLGALGPQRVHFDQADFLCHPPSRLMHNEESWLDFADLVLIDPPDTGWSSSVQPPPASGATPPQGPTFKTPKSPLWEVEKDLKTICMFIVQFLSKHQRWESPLFLCGESYGGYRTARLAQMLQADFGVGLKGVVLVSPAMELPDLVGTPYTINPWADTFPSLALSAWHHGKAPALAACKNVEEARASAEAFLHKRLLPWLFAGNGLGEDEVTRTANEMAAHIGLDARFIRDKGGRIEIQEFMTRLLADERKVLSAYDGTITMTHPFPGSSTAPEITFIGWTQMIMPALQCLLREKMGIESDRRYSPLNLDANAGWSAEARGFLDHVPSGAADLQTSMAANPRMKVYVVHGHTDLVTPYFSSKRVLSHFALPGPLMDNARLVALRGGHMFYSWDDSRAAFRDLGRELCEG